MWSDLARYGATSAASAGDTRLLGSIRCSTGHAPVTPAVSAEGRSDCGSLPRPPRLSPQMRQGWGMILGSFPKFRPSHPRLSPTCAITRACWRFRLWVARLGHLGALVATWADVCPTRGFCALVGCRSGEDRGSGQCPAVPARFRSEPPDGRRWCQISSILVPERRERPGSRFPGGALAHVGYVYIYVYVKIGPVPRKKPGFAAVYRFRTYCAARPAAIVVEPLFGVEICTRGPR